MATVNSNLHDPAEAIRTRGDLVAFVRDLAHEARTRPGEWENATLDTYLEALASWVEDSDGYYRNRGEIPPEQPSWEMLGRILAAASVYE